MKHYWTRSKTHGKLSKKAKALKELKQQYYTAGHPLAFSAPNRIYQQFKGRLSLKDIHTFLAAQDVYTTHRHAKKDKTFNPVYIYAKRSHVEIDLGTFEDVPGFIVIIIDAFTKKAFTEWIPNKSADVVLEAFKSLYFNKILSISRLICDQGTEFWNRKFLQFLTEEGIKIFSPRTRGHAVFVERCWGSLKTLLGKWRYHNNTKDFRPALQDITDTYNHRIHRSISTTPELADTSEAVQMRIRHLNEERWKKIRQQKKRFSVGQLVRIRRDGGAFERAHHLKFTEELFQVKEISVLQKIPLYTLTDLSGEEEIRGQFTARELVGVKLSRHVHVGQLLRKEGGKALVTLKNLPDDIQAWVPLSELVP